MVSEETIRINLIRRETNNTEDIEYKIKHKKSVKI